MSQSDPSHAAQLTKLERPFSPLSLATVDAYKGPRIHFSSGQFWGGGGDFDPRKILVKLINGELISFAAQPIAPNFLFPIHETLNLIGRESKPGGSGKKSMGRHGPATDRC